MLQIKGKVNTAICFARVVEDEAIDLNHGKEEYFAKRDQIIEEYKAAGRKSEIQTALKALKWEKRDADVPDDLCYLYGKYLEDYRKAMDGIYTTSVNTHTLDEAPMAYKSLEDIIDVIEDSVDVIEILKPVFNFKAS